MSKQERDNQLLEIARSLILEKGMVSFSFVDIAKQAEISRATLYKHFSGKEDVLVGLFIKDVGSTRDMMVDIQNDQLLNDREKLITSLLAPVSLSMENQNLTGVNFLSANPGIYTFASESRQQALSQVLAMMRDISMQFWFGPLQRGTLKGTKEALLPVLAAVYPYQRGCVMIPQNVMTHGNQINRSLQDVFNNLMFFTESLGWQGQAREVSYEKVLKAIGKYERTSMIPC